LVVAHDHAKDVDCDFRFAVRNGRIPVAGSVRDEKSTSAEESLRPQIYTDGDGLIRITIHAS